MKASDLQRWATPLHPRWRRRISAIRLGFLRIAPGYVSSIALCAIAALSVPAAVAAPPDATEVLECLEALAEREAERSLLLEEAERIGLSGERDESALRKGESIQSRTLDLELQIMLLKTRCRGLAQEKLDLVEQQIEALQQRILLGAGRSNDAEALVQLRQTRAQLEEGMGDPIVHQYPILALSPDDTRATLQDKLQYYQEVQESLEALKERIGKREKKIREEAEALREARRLVGDLAFADMGDRTSGERSSTLRLKLPDEDAGTGNPGRDGSVIPWDEVGGDLEFVLRLAANTPEESAQILELLDSFRGDIERELSSVGEQSAAIQLRLSNEAALP